MADIGDAAGLGRADMHAAIEAMRLQQVELAAKVRLRDGYASPLRTVAGFSVDCEDEGTIVRAAAVLLDADSLQVLASESVRMPAAISRIPGLLSFRAMPALLAVLESLPNAPDLAFVEGPGIAHPSGLGIAAHFGVTGDLASIGVADTIVTGNGSEPHQVRGAYTPLRDQGRQCGWLLRSKLGSDPLVVSPGHRMSMASTADLVMRFTREHRRPEPLRLAGLLASRPQDARAGGV